jgi:hypothetical protein
MGAGWTSRRIGVGTGTQAARCGRCMLALLLLGACTAQVPIHAEIPIQQQALPPPLDMQDRSAINANAVSAFVSADPGWQAWLMAIRASQTANDALADASTDDVPVWRLNAALTLARDSYRRATSFYLVPVMMRSSCLDLASETNGAVQLGSGLVIRYRSFATETHRFPNGSSCLRRTGYVSEVDSSRGMAIVAAPKPEAINWQQNFARSLGWGTPFGQISRDNSYSVTALIGAIGR